MAEQAVVHSTFVIERAFPKPPARVFEAFADPAQKRRWFADGLHHEVLEYALDFRAGGVERVVYRFGPSSPFPGVLLSNETRFLVIEPARRIVATQAMDLAGNRISATLVTFELFESGAGADLLCTHQGAFFEGADGPQMREQGWRALFDKLGAELA